LFSRYQNFSVDFLFKFLFSKRAGALIKIISWLSIIGIGTGVASLIIVLSVMNGFNKSIRARKFSVEPHLVVYFKDLSLKEINAHPAVQWIRSQPNQQSDVTETQDVILRTNDGFVQGAVAEGMSRKTLQFIVEQNRKRRTSGSADDKNIWQLKPGEILVGAGVGDIMGLFERDQLIVLSPESLLGPRESLRQLESVRVGHFIHTDVDEIDSQKIFYILGESLVRLRNSASLERVLEIRLTDPENYQAMKAKIESFGLRVDSWKERNSNLFYSLKLEKFVVGLLLGLSTIIAGFSLVTVMVLLLTQKRKDIGLLLALGFPARRLRDVFVRMGVGLSCLGIFGGFLFGILASEAIGKYSAGFLPNIYEETNIPTEIQPAQIIFIVSLAVILSYLTAWLSIRQLSRWDPVYALKGN
jgi:lipoprotein-releasing system permease protein